MYLIEHDAKELLAAHGIPVPPGFLLENKDLLDGGSLPPGPWMIKAQIRAGGRGKAGIIREACTVDEVAFHSRVMFDTTVKSQRIKVVRIEQKVVGAVEAYVGMLIDAAAGGIRVIMSPRGGVDVEVLEAEHVKSEVSPPELGALCSCVRRLAATMPVGMAEALRDAGEQLARIFLNRETLLIEINPLFVHPEGKWSAGDAKVITDDNALPRQPMLLELAEKQSARYPETVLKASNGFDYLVVDPDGEIGLLTTGAGLSMMLIDELREAGLRPYNFLDIRTGGFRGEITRLVQVLDWISAGANVRVLLINIFAGITDLGEFARLLVAALAEVPGLDVPVVARLVGNGLPAAQEILSAAGIQLHTDLEEAVGEVRKHLQGRAYRRRSAT